MFYGFFRKVFLHNLSGVPSDKPVLLAANHPTAFVDPCLLCTFVDPPIYNMTRGDVFQKPLFRALMESINMFPVYRVRDGYGGRDRNDDVFDYCIEKLHDRRVVTIYVESEHHLEKKVRPVQKGIARIAFAAFERHQLDDLQVIPAGCNYVRGDRPRDEAMVNIGDPIFVKNYWDDYQRDPAAALQRLCNDIEKALQSICYHLDHEADEPLAERLLTLCRSDFPEPPLPVVVRNPSRFLREKAVLDHLNVLPTADKILLHERTERYFAALGQAGLDDAALVNKKWGDARWLLFFIAGTLPALVGWLGSWPFVQVAKHLADTKVKKREFYSSVRMGAAFLMGFPYYLLLIVVCLFSGKAVWVAVGLLLPLLGWFAEFYRDMWQRWRAAVKAAQHPERAKLLGLRQAVESLPTFGPTRSAAPSRRTG